MRPAYTSCTTNVPGVNSPVRIHGIWESFGALQVVEQCLRDGWCGNSGV